MNKQTNQTQDKNMINVPCAMDLLAEQSLPHIHKTGTNAAQYQTNEKGEIYFNGYRDYIQEYVEVIKEWQRLGIEVETALHKQAVKMRKAQNNALKYSGLDLNELTLIAYCRLHSDYSLFRIVNTYFHQVLDLIS